MRIDFDAEIPRAGTSAFKYEGRMTVFGTDDVRPLWVADMDFAAPEAVTRALMARAAHPVYGYSLAPDSLFDALVAWMKQRHQWAIEREWIVLTPGVVPSLVTAIMALTQPGEGVVVQPPVYFPFYSTVSKNDRRIVENPLRLDKGCYGMDFERLEQCAQQAKLLLLCSPHNPVGRVWHRDELLQILDIAERHQLTIISDEIHADLIYPEYRHHALAALVDHPAYVITAVAPSKTFNIPGLGLSALIVPDPAHRAAIQKVLEQAHASVTNPFSLVAFEAAFREGGAWLESLITYLQGTRDAATDYIAHYLPEIHLIPPEGTYLLWLDCRGLAMSDGALREFMIKEARLGLSPGISFGAGGEGFMRMNIGAPRRQVMDALSRIRQAIDTRNVRNKQNR